MGLVSTSHVPLVKLVLVNHRLTIYENPIFMSRKQTAMLSTKHENEFSKAIQKPCSKTYQYLLHQKNRSKRDIHNSGSKVLCLALGYSESNHHLLSP